MKAEERKHLHQNDLATRLKDVWQTVASGSAVNTIVWAVLLLGLVLAIGWRYYSDATFKSRSALWSQLERASDTEELERVIKEHPGTVAARIARFHLTRWRMEDVLGRVAGPSAEDRVKAAGELEEVHKTYAELARDSGAEPTLVQEALMGVANSEEVLAGIPKADSKEPRGSLDQAITAYRELANRFPNSFLGEKAAKRAAELSAHTAQVRAFYDALMEVHGKPAPTLLPEAPKAPEAGKASGPSLPDAPKAPDVPAPPPAGDASKSAPKPDGEKPKQ
jgi:hypothetical protein